MAHRLAFEAWQLVFPVAALLVALAIYAFGFHRALRMRETKVRHLENMPLED